MVNDPRNLGNNIDYKTPNQSYAAPPQPIPQIPQQQIQQMQIHDQGYTAGYNYGYNQGYKDGVNAQPKQSGNGCIIALLFVMALPTMFGIVASIISLLLGGGLFAWLWNFLSQFY